MTDPQSARTMTLEALADTIIPGDKRGAADRTVAGAVADGGAVAAGAVTLLELPEGGLAPMLDALVLGLNGHAAGYAAEHGLPLDEAVPPFVALPFADRTSLVQALTGRDHPERELWVGVAIFCYMAFDSAAHLHTADAVAAGHVGLATMGFANPDADGLWRFPAHSYGRQLAPLHPDTTLSGSPA
jgi:enediyne biosynthesis protein E8